MLAQEFSRGVAADTSIRGPGEDSGIAGKSAVAKGACAEMFIFISTGDACGGAAATLRTGSPEVATLAHDLEDPETLRDVNTGFGPSAAAL
jgi:hypothetical protein